LNCIVIIIWHRGTYKQCYFRERGRE